MTSTRPVLYCAAVLTFALAATTCLLEAGQPAAGKAPGETYLAYRAAMLKAKTIEETMPWLAKEARAQVEKTPKDERSMMFEFMQEMAGAVTGLEVVNESVKGETAALQVRGTDAESKSKVTGTITMVREDGAWKVAKESWGAGM
jgi:hypothetical protein